MNMYRLNSNIEWMGEIRVILEHCGLELDSVGEHLIYILFSMDKAIEC
jgi:hypothetical protein